MNHQEGICKSGRGNRWHVDPIEFQNTSSNPIGSNRVEVGEFIQLTWHVPTGPTSPRQSIAVWALSTTNNEAINREPQRVATGATAAPTAIDHRTAYPGGGSSKKVMAIASTIFHDRPSATRTKRSTQNTEENLKTSIAASPSLSRAWRLRAPPPTQEKLRVIASACATKKKQRLSAARTRRCTLSLSSALLGACQPGVV